MEYPVRGRVRPVRDDVTSSGFIWVTEVGPMWLVDLWMREAVTVVLTVGPVVRSTIMKPLNRFHE